MSPEVRAMVEMDIEKSIEPFARGTGAMAIIDTFFGEIYTTLKKRMDMMMAKMKPAESATAFVARLNKLFLEADIEAMVADDFKSFILIAGITNQQLRKKLLDIKDPTYMDLCQKVTRWVVATNMEKAITSTNQAATINQVNSGRGRGRGRGGQSRGGGRGGASNPGDRQSVTQGPPPTSIKNTPTSLQGKCINCGASGHERKSCTVDKTTLKCKKCGRSGHLEKVCLKDYNEWRFPTKPDQAAKVRHVSSSSMEDEEEESQ